MRGGGGRGLRKFRSGLHVAVREKDAIEGTVIGKEER